jgi:hypothetical protein
MDPQVHEVEDVTVIPIPGDHLVAANAKDVMATVSGHAAKKLEKESELTTG